MEVPVREATCTEDGITEGIVCTICGEVLSGCTIIKAEGHNPTLVEGYPATRERDGLTDGFQCSTCGAMLIEQMPIVIPHTADQNKPYVPVALDGITYEVGPTGRIQISIWADGKQEVRKGLKINHKNESLGKTFTLFSRTVTCEKDGMSEYVTVENSDGSRDSQLGPIEIKALGHSYGSWTEEQGDCQTASSRFRTCSRCGHEDRQTQGKAEHNWAANGENYEEEVDGFVVWGHYEECSVCHEQRRIEDGREKLIVED